MDNGKRPPRSSGPELLLLGMTRADFLALRDEWYERLAAEGFVDHECFGADGDVLPLLKSTPTHDVQRFNRQRSSMGYEYYARCRQFLEAASRRRPRGFDREVWVLHCEGHSRRQVAGILGKHDSTVRHALRRCHVAMALWWRDTARARAEDEAQRDEEVKRGSL